MTVKTNIAAGLKKARKSAGMNVDEIGEALGKSGKTISAWEVGRGQPDGDELILLCKLLSVHLRDFYGDEFGEYVSENAVIDNLADDEADLVRLYRAANDIGKEAIMSVARAVGEKECGSHTNA